MTNTALRPRLHFTPRVGWMNDPHGVTFHDGTYHLFFQYVPDSLAWREDCHWGHATSPDLLHWEEQPIALSPGDGDAGCWSGGLAVTDDGEPLIFYTAAVERDLGRGQVRLARSADADWTTWTKGEVVASAQTDETHVFRDPVVFRDGDGWRMLVGYGAADGTAGAETFASPDLESWTPTGLLATRHTSTGDPWTGTAWECPQLLRDVGAGDVLVVSVWAEHGTHYVAAAGGTYADGRFEARAWQRLTANNAHYAASAFTDAEGRSCLMFWIRDIGEPDAWTGAMSVPYLVALADDGIRLTPHPAVAAARTPPDGDEPGTTLDLEWSPGPAGRLALVGADGHDRAVLERRNGVLTVSVAGHEPVPVAHEAATVRVLVDAQVLEVVADGRLVGLPLSDVDGGVLPRADDPTALAWWHLT